MRSIALLAAVLICPLATGRGPADTTRYTHADTLRGSNGPARAWWDARSTTSTSA